MKIKILFCLILIFASFATSSVFALDKVDINTATLVQLDEITGVGPSTAQKIVDARPYATLDDLLKVKGIGPATLQKIKDQGVACVNCTTSILATQPSQTTTTNDTEIIKTVTTAGATPIQNNITYSAGVVINEILPSPQGADEENEWIELYNKNNFDVDLASWKLQDTDGTTTNYTIPAGVKILANNFLVLKRSDTKINLNNTSDSVKLLFPDGKTADSVSFTKAPLGQSYNLINFENWAWSTTLTPNLKNIITQAASVAKNIKASKKNPTIQAKDALAALSELQKSDNNIIEEKQNNPWFLFVTVLLVAIIMGFGALIIRLKFNKIKN